MTPVLCAATGMAWPDPTWSLLNGYHPGQGVTGKEWPVVNLDSRQTGQRADQLWRWASEGVAGSPELSSAREKFLFQSCADWRAGEGGKVTFIHTVEAFFSLFILR